MADTLGSLIDKLTTVDLKMWNNQELLYEIRRMSFEEYKAKYFDTEDGAQKLWESLKRACDLNVQRNQLIDEVAGMYSGSVVDSVSLNLQVDKS